MTQQDGLDLKSLSQVEVAERKITEAITELSELFIAQNPGLTRADSKRVLAIMLGEITEGLRNGERIYMGKRFRSKEDGKERIKLHTIIVSKINKILDEYAPQKPAR